MCPQNIKVLFFYIHFFKFKSFNFFSDLYRIPCFHTMYNTFHPPLGERVRMIFSNTPQKKKHHEEDLRKSPGNLVIFFQPAKKKNLRGAIVALQVLVSQSQLFNNDKPWLLPRQPARQESSNGVFSTFCEIRKLLGGGGGNMVFSYNFFLLGRKKN